MPNSALPTARRSSRLLSSFDMQPSSTIHIGDSSRPVASIAFFIAVAIVVAAILATATGVMDLSGMMEDLLSPTVTTPPPFVPSAS